MACDPDNKPKKAKLREHLDPGRYRKVSTRLWNDQRFLALSPPPPCGRYLVLFLLTNPATNSIPGLYRARETALAEELGWTLEGFRGAFREAEAQGFIRADWKVGLVWLPKAVRHDPPGNPNVVKGWARIIRNELPECALLAEAVAGITTCLEGLFENPEPFREAFLKALPEAFREALPKPSTKPLGTPPESLPQIQKPETRSQRPEARDQRPEAPPAQEAGPLPLTVYANAQEEPLPPEAYGASEVERATDEAGLLPHEPPPPAEPPLMELLAQDFAAARGAEYSPDRGDDAAMRELLRRGPPAEVRRRWRIGIAVPPGKYGRVSKLGDLVRLWNDCDAAPSTAPPADAHRRAALEVGKGTEPPRQACATGCGQVSSQLVWGHALDVRCIARLEAAVPHWTADSVTAWVRGERARNAAQQLGGTP